METNLILKDGFIKEYKSSIQDFKDSRERKIYLEVENNEGEEFTIKGFVEEKGFSDDPISNTLLSIMAEDIKTLTISEFYNRFKKELKKYNYKEESNKQRKIEVTITKVSEKISIPLKDGCINDIYTDFSSITYTKGYEEIECLDNEVVLYVKKNDGKGFEINIHSEQSAFYNNTNYTLESLLFLISKAHNLTISEFYSELKTKLTSWNVEKDNYFIRIDVNIEEFK